MLWSCTVPDLDLAIRGGTVATASDTFRADVGVRDGRIVAVAEAVEGAAREIDASGLLVLPGGIDSHVHIAQPSGRASSWPTASPRRPPPPRRAETPA
jgi:dihydropyrimidinase